MRKMLVSDYDQTFYINDTDIELNKKSINNFMMLDNLFVIATGRSYFDFNYVLNKHDLKYDYVILNHGATILDKKNNILFNKSISNEILLELKQDLKLEDSLNYSCCSSLDSYDYFIESNITKICVKYENTEFLNLIVENLKVKYNDFINIYYIRSNKIEITAKDVTKASSIYVVMEKEKIEKDNVYTIGDSYSDIKMVEDFNGYCMENAIDELKKVAVKQVGSVSSLVEDILN